MESGSYFVGPAVVVDDQVHDDHSGIAIIVEQLESAGFPVVKFEDLPDDDVHYKHWSGFSLILLDWELVSSAPGVDLPDALKKANSERLSAFIKRILTDNYCPVVIVSSHGEDKIRATLATAMGVDIGELAHRVLVASKTAMSTGLLSKLEAWVRSLPAIYVLKCWENGYREARRNAFQDLELSASNWPLIVWSAAVEDKINPSHEITNTVTSNILHRFNPLLFDSDVLAPSAGFAPTPSAYRSVAHRRAVVPAYSLHPDVVEPGDFYSIPGSDDVLINVTASCDLVPRSKFSPDIRLTLIRCTRIDADSYSKPAKIDSLVKRHLPTSEILFVLSPTLPPYRADFKSWHEASWLEVRRRRLGRLLEPYSVHLQQRFASYLHRQGLPRLDSSFFQD